MDLLHQNRESEVRVEKNIGVAFKIEIFKSQECSLMPKYHWLLKS